MYWLFVIMLMILNLKEAVHAKDNLYVTKERKIRQVESVSDPNSTIGNIIDQEFETAFIGLSNPTLDTKSFTSASQVALLFSSLDLHSVSLLDASLENNKIQNVAKTLSEFRAAMQNTGKIISDTLRAVHNSMLSIQTNFDDVPDLVVSLIAAYKNLEDNGSKYSINLQMKNFVDIVKLCSDEAKKVVRSLNGPVDLIAKSVSVAKQFNSAFDEQKRWFSEEIQRLRIEKEGIVEKKRLNEEQKLKQLTGIRKILFKKKMEEKLKQIEDALNKSISDIDTPITDLENSNAELLKIETMVTEYASLGVKVLNEIQEQWIKLQHFFVSMQTVVVVPITRHMLTFDSIVQASHMKGSGTLGNQIITNGFKSVVLSVSVARTANIYNEVSNKFVLPVLDASVRKQQLSKEAVKAAMDEISQRIQSSADECQKFIETRVRDSKEKSINQMKKFRDEIRTKF